jgi:hypothetical protein
VKNVVNRQQLLFTKTWRHSKIGCILCTIRGEKHPRDFVKVVEGSEIYNFPIHHFVHFYSNFWSFKHSNRGAVTQGQAGRSRVTRVPTASAPHARLPNAALRLPNAPRPETPHAPRRIIRVAHCPPVRRGFPCARADRGRSPYCELRPGCPVAVTARSPSPPIKQAAAGHPRVRREPAVPTVRSPTVRCTSYRLVHRHTFPRPPKSYPHRPLPFPGEGSPEQELPQRLPPGAAVHRRQPLLDPQLRSK